MDLLHKVIACTWIWTLETLLSKRITFIYCYQGSYNLFSLILILKKAFAKQVRVRPRDDCQAHTKKAYQIIMQIYGEKSGSARVPVHSAWVLSLQLFRQVETHLKASSLKELSRKQKKALSEPSLQKSLGETLCWVFLWLFLEELWSQLRS